jgi:hypothetical protein
MFTENREWENLRRSSGGHQVDNLLDRGSGAASRHQRASTDWQVKIATDSRPFADGVSDG